MIALIAAPPIGVFLAMGPLLSTRRCVVLLITIVFVGVLTVLTAAALVVDLLMDWRLRVSN